MTCPDCLDPFWPYVVDLHVCMHLVGVIGDAEIWQCPKCKKIDIDFRTED